MARPAPDLPPAAVLAGRIDPQGRLAVRVSPGARGEGIVVEAQRVLVRVRAKPQDGAANVAVLALLARALGIAPSRLRLLRGDTGRDKLIGVDLADR